MKILVCFKLQPDPDRVLEEDLRSFSPGMDLGYAGLAFNCFDESALELGIRLKEAAVQENTCTAVTVAGDLPGDFAERLLAVGYDRVVWIPKAHTEFCPETLSQELSALGKDYDLILMGREAGFGESGMVPCLTAARLGYEIFSGVEALEAGEPPVLLCRDEEGLWARKLTGKALAVVGNSPAVLRAPTLRQRMKCRGRGAERREPVTADREVLPQLTRLVTGRTCRMLSPEDPETFRLVKRLLREAAENQEKSSAESGKTAGKLGIPAFLGDPEPGASWESLPDVPLILLPDTAPGRTLAAALAVKAGRACCFGAELPGAEGDSVRVRKRAFGGTLLREQRLRLPAVVTCPKLWELGEPVRIPGNPDLPGQLREPAEASNLQNARAVLVCGSGMGSREACSRAREIAAGLGAAFGLTRPVALNAWGSPGEILGQSGLQIRPDCCLVLGAAGAGAFLLGVRQAKTLIAVNTDPNALIFRAADYGIRMDANTFLEHLI